MPPGEYDFRLFAVRETTPEAAIQSSEFEGQAKITISGKAGTQKLDIVAAPPGTRRAKRKGRAAGSGQVGEVIAVSRGRLRSAAPFAIECRPGWGSIASARESIGWQTAFAARVREPESVRADGNRVRAPRGAAVFLPSCKPVVSWLPRHAQSPARGDTLSLVCAAPSRGL